MAKRSSGRAAARNATAASKNTPQKFGEEPEDEQMNNAPTSETDLQDGDDNVAEEEEGTPPNDSDNQSAPATPNTGEPFRGKRRLGRPPKPKPAGWDNADDKGNNSEQGTPAKRGRGRGGFGRGGGRWAKRGGPTHATQQVDKDGNMLDIVDDEVDLPEDAEGETKVDKMGYLQGDREYRCRTFTVIGRGRRLYMLSTEPARCVGFRDSYLFFTKHKRLYKIIIDDEEKRDLIERELIPHSYKGRAIGVCTARSVFREFGAKIIVGGKRITDDYEVATAKAEGVIEGALADPDDAVRLGEIYNKNQYVAWHGASAVYHSGAPTVPVQGGKIVEGKKRRVMINDGNWMLEHARAASQFNAAIGVQRRKNLKGIYEPHTNVMQYPRIMQPTHAKWQQVDDLETLGIEEGHAEDQEDEHRSIFEPVNPAYARTYRIFDTVYEAPDGPWGVPGPDGDAIDVGFNSLDAVSDEVLAELPLECRIAFDQALRNQLAWKNKWSTESRDGNRGIPPIDRGQF